MDEPVFPPPQLRLAVSRFDRLRGPLAALAVVGALLLLLASTVRLSSTAPILQHWVHALALVLLALALGTVGTVPAGGLNHRRARAALALCSTGLLLLFSTFLLGQGQPVLIAGLTASAGLALVAAMLLVLWAERVQVLLFALLLGLLTCAAAGQWEFRLGYAALERAYDLALHHRNQGLFWLALLVAPLAAARFWTRRTPMPDWRLSTGQVLLGLTVLVLVGAGLRFFRLSSLPPGLWIDEALNGQAAVQILETGRPILYLRDRSSSLAGGFVNFAAVYFWFFQPTDGALGIRSAAAIAGVLSHAALALAGWVLFGPRVALLSTAFIAVSHYHLNYSRWGEMPVMSSGIEALVAACVFAGMATARWSTWLCFALAGGFFGLGIYTYMSYRLFVVCMVVFGLVLLTWWLVKGRWCFLLPAFVGALVALAVAWPMIHYARTHQDVFTDRARQTLVITDPADPELKRVHPQWAWRLTDSTVRSVLGFVFIGDSNPRHNLPNYPLLTFVPAMLAPVGLLLCLSFVLLPASRMRENDIVPPGTPAPSHPIREEGAWLRYLFVWLWFVFGLVPGAITLEAPHASRLIDCLFPLALMVGVAADWLLGALMVALPRARVGFWLGHGALLLSAVVTARQEYRAYFIERPKQVQVYDGFLPQEAAPARFLENPPENVTLLLDRKTYGSPTVRFLARDTFRNRASDIRLLRPSHDFPALQPADRDLLLVYAQPYYSLSALLPTFFPGATIQEHHDPFGRLIFTTCRVPADDYNAFRQAVLDRRFVWPHGLLGKYYSTPDASGEPYYQAVLPFTYCDYELTDAPIGHFRFAEWTGFIELPTSGPYYFRLNPDPSTLWIDDTQIIFHQQENCFGGDNYGRAVLEQGRHAIRITLAEHPKVHYYFLWFYWEPPGSSAEWVPATALYPPQPLMP